MIKALITPCDASQSGLAKRKKDLKRNKKYAMLMAEKPQALPGFRGVGRRR